MELGGLGDRVASGCADSTTGRDNVGTSGRPALRPRPSHGGAPSIVKGVPAPSREWPIPTNLIVPEVVRPLVTSMYRRSPTFRRQCARLAEHQEVTVRIELEIGVRYGRARSRVERDHGGLTRRYRSNCANPRRMSSSSLTNWSTCWSRLMARILARLARQGLDGVVEGEGAYETARARSVGRLVAREAMRPWYGQRGPVASRQCLLSAPQWDSLHSVAVR